MSELTKWSRAEPVPVLLIEDNPDNRRGILEQLTIVSSTVNLTVVTAASAQSAQEILCPGSFGIGQGTGIIKPFWMVLMDDQLPPREGDMPRTGMGKSLLNNLHFLQGSDQLPFTHIVGVSSDPDAQAYLSKFPGAAQIGKDYAKIASFVKEMLLKDFGTT